MTACAIFGSTTSPSGSRPSTPLVLNFSRFTFYEPMPIPPFDTNGLLPTGIYVCTLPEVRERFGGFQGSEQRPRLFQRLEAFIGDARAAGIVCALIINGSFVTAQTIPNDIDLVVVLRAGHDFHAELGAAPYHVVDRARVRRAYGFDVFVAEDGSPDFAALVRFFQRVRLQPGLSKGILRMNL